MGKKEEIKTLNKYGMKALEKYGISKNDVVYYYGDGNYIVNGEVIKFPMEEHLGYCNKVKECDGEKIRKDSLLDLNFGMSLIVDIKYASYLRIAKEYGISNGDTISYSGEDGIFVLNGKRIYIPANVACVIFGYAYEEVIKCLDGCSIGNVLVVDDTNEELNVIGFNNEGICVNSNVSGIRVISFDEASTIHGRLMLCDILFNNYELYHYGDTIPMYNGIVVKDKDGIGLRASYADVLNGLECTWVYGSTGHKVFQKSLNNKE